MEQEKVMGWPVFKLALLIESTTERNHFQGQGKSMYTFSAKRLLLSAPPPPTCWLYAECIIGGRGEAESHWRSTENVYVDLPRPSLSQFIILSYCHWYQFTTKNEQNVIINEFGRRWLSFFRIVHRTFDQDPSLVPSFICIDIAFSDEHLKA